MRLGVGESDSGWGLDGFFQLRVGDRLSGREQSQQTGGSRAAPAPPAIVAGAIGSTIALRHFPPGQCRPGQCRPGQCRPGLRPAQHRDPQISSTSAMRAIRPGDMTAGLRALGGASVRNYPGSNEPASNDENTHDGIFERGGLSGSRRGVSIEVRSGQGFSASGPAGAALTRGDAITVAVRHASRPSKCPKMRRSSAGHEVPRRIQPRGLATGGKLGC